VSAAIEFKTVTTRETGVAKSQTIIDFSRDGVLTENIHPVMVRRISSNQSLRSQKNNNHFYLRVG